MFEQEITRYQKLNRLAESNGVVIIGSGTDASIPVGELKQAFYLKDNIYNRSFAALKASDGTNVYNSCVAELCPDTVILHIGENDTENFDEHKKEFEISYRNLINNIRSSNKKRQIVIVPVKNDSSTAAEINGLLKNIAKAENCIFEDITTKNPGISHEDRETLSMLCSLGFVSPLKAKHHIGNLVRVLFCSGI